MQKFSIIIPTYNSAKTLPVSLESIANQNFKNVEVLIMDGASNDQTTAIAASFKKSIPNLAIYSEKDQGIYDAMNKGMNKATGEWLLFLGSDDSLYDSNVLNKVEQRVNKTNAKVVYGNAKIIGDTGWAKDAAIYDGEFTTNKLLNTNICHQAVFYNSGFVKNQIGDFNLKYHINSDWDFNLRCWAKQSCEYADIIIANFKAGGVSSNSTDSAMAKDFVENVCNYFKIDPFNPWLNKPTFVFYKNAVALQKSRYPLRYAALQLKNLILKTKILFWKLLKK